MKKIYTTIVICLCLINFASGQCIPISSTYTISNQTVTAPASASFSVSATGTSITYQWQYSINSGGTWNNVPNSSPYSGTTSSTLTINPTSTSMSGYLFRCSLVNACTVIAYTNWGTLTVNSGCIPISSTYTISNQTVTAPASASFSVSATGTSITYQWQYSINSGGTWNNVPNSSPYSGTTSSTLTINPTSNSMSGYLYRCSLVNACTVIAYTNWGTLTVNSGCIPISSTYTISNQTVTAPASASFSVSATGTSITYQWQYSINSGGTWNNVPNSSPYSGTTSSTLSINPTSTSMSGYLYRCSLVNACTIIAYTNWGTLTVNSGCIAPSISVNPSNQSVTVPNSANFSVSATGSSLLYQWQLSTNGGSTYSNLSNVSPYSGVNTNTLSIFSTTLSMNNYRYRCFVSSSCTIATATSNGAILSTNPVTYWIGAYTRPENNPSFPNEKFLKSATSFVPATSAVKVCADGSKATIIKLNCDNPNLNMQNIRFKIASDPTNSNSNLYGEFNASSYYSNSSLAQVRFTHPNYLASGLHRIDTILAYDINSPSIILIRIPIKVCRASMLFVHGLWGAYSSFQEMDNYFINYYTPSNLVTFRADYSTNNGAAKSFSYNTYTSLVLPTNIYNTLNKAIGLDFSAGKVDVVSHSMGGVLTRLYMQSTSYLFNIHSFTTINTPHSGTQAANLFKSSLGVPMWPALLAMGRCINCGALDDLKYNSTYFSNNYNLNGNARKVPSLVFTSDSYNQFGSDAIGMDLLWAMNSLFFGSVGIFSPLMLTQSLYNPDISDVIVPLSSQQGGVSTSLHYNSTTHVQAEKNPTLFSDLRFRLGQNPLGAFYNQNGFTHSNLNMPWWFYLPSVIPLMPASSIADTINISNPTDSLTYNVGDTVNFQISRLSGNIYFIGCGLENQGQTISTNFSIDSVLNFQYIIPSTVYGTVKALAYGLNGSGTFDYDSIYFFVNINATLDSMQLLTDSMLIPVGNYDNINVDGFYSDSVTRAISTMQGMIYTILDTNIVSLTGINTLYAKQIGTTQVIADYQGLSDTMFVTVYQGQNNNNALFSVLNNVVCGSGDVQFFDQSDGTPISWEWQFPGGTPSTSTDQHPLINYSNNGTHDVTLITSWSTGTDTLFIPTYIIVDSIPSATITPSGSTSFCQGQSVQLNANSGAGYNYFWSNGNTTQSITVSDSGDFSVTVIDSLGCNAISAIQSIVVFNNPTPTITGNTSICQNDSTTLDAGSGYTNYLWSTSETTQTINVNMAATFTVTVTDGNGCSGTDNFILTVNNLPSPVITGIDTICDGDSTTLDAGSGYTNYLWSTTATSQTITISTAGTFLVTVTDANGCINSTSANVTVNSTDTSVSANGFTLMANAVGAIYQWIYCDSVLITGETNQTFIATQNGSYAVIVSQNGCTDTSNCYLIVGVGISQINGASNISIYPNPTNGLLNIKVNGLLNEKYKIILTNTLGQILNEKEFTATNNSIETQLDMKELSSGIYILGVTSSKIKQTFKVQKQ